MIPEKVVFPKTHFLPIRIDTKLAIDLEIQWSKQMRFIFLIPFFFDGGFSWPRDLPASPTPRRDSPRFTWRTGNCYVGATRASKIWATKKCPSLRFKNGTLIMVYENPYISWVGCHPHIYPQQPCVLFIAHRVNVLGLASPMVFPALICTWAVWGKKNVDVLTHTTHDIHIFIYSGYIRMDF